VFYQKLTGICRITLDEKGTLLDIIPDPVTFRLYETATLDDGDDGGPECETNADCEEILLPLHGYDRVCIDGECHYRKQGQ